MLLMLSGISTLASAFKLLLLLFVFFALLYGAHLFTKVYAKSGYVNAKSMNISVVESQQLVPGKSIVIAKIGTKYVSFVLTKENATFLTELEEEELHFREEMPQSASFLEVFRKAKRGNGKDENLNS